MSLHIKNSNICLTSFEEKVPWRFSVAPMLGFTDRHFRALSRFLSRRALLYTEMVTAPAFLLGKVENRRLSSSEGSVALQLAGSDPRQLAQCAQIASSLGYYEINLNVGCPSKRLQALGGGAALFLQPRRAAQCVSAMQDACEVPITLKTRIGVDDFDRPQDLWEFIEKTAQAGCRRYILHARKAWLKGLNPRQNRAIPLLDYSRVYECKQRFPNLTFILNGGILSLSEEKLYLDRVDGVMIGRAIYQNPTLLSQVDETFYGQPAEPMDYENLLSKTEAYILKEKRTGMQSFLVYRHLLGLFSGTAYASIWRKELLSLKKQIFLDHSLCLAYKKYLTQGQKD